MTDVNSGPNKTFYSFSVLSSSTTQEQPAHQTELGSLKTKHIEEGRSDSVCS